MNTRRNYRGRAAIPAGCLFVLAALAVVAGPADSAAAVGNPAWPSACPLHVVLAVDLSSSMAPDIGRVRTASDDLIDSLRGSASRLTVIGFGTDAEVIAQDVDVADKSARKALKRQVNDLDALGGSAGGTNWDAALRAAGKAEPQLVLMLTDGYPSAYGSPAVGGDEEQSLTAAAKAADRLKSGGTRVVVVGIGLDHGIPQNLPRISGPVAGDDYYATSADALLHQLYEISSKACGVPIAALPKPEPLSFPLKKVVLGALALIALLGLIGAAASRRAGGPPARVAAGRSPRIPDPTIKIDEVTSRLGAVGEPGSRSEIEPEPDLEPDLQPDPPPRARPPSMSLDFLNDTGRKDR